MKEDRRGARSGSRSPPWRGGRPSPGFRRSRSSSRTPSRTPEKKHSFSPAESYEKPSHPAAEGGEGGGEFESLEISAQRGVAGQFDQTDTTLDMRFTEECDNPLSFMPKENISVGIERNIPGNEPAVVGGELFPDQVLITRRRGEGEVPLHQRDEFLGPQDDDLSERRVIRVAKGLPDTHDSALGGRDNFEVRRTLDSDERKRARKGFDR